MITGRVGVLQAKDVKNTNHEYEILFISYVIKYNMNYKQNLR